jgi:hypothetical protein
MPVDVLTGFLDERDGDARGRPVGVAIDGHGRVCWWLTMWECYLAESAAIVRRPRVGIGIGVRKADGSRTPILTISFR